MITIRDVANRAGVSIATVSSVINNSRPVSDKTRRLVESAIRALNYVPNRAARSLKSGRARVIVYIVPTVTNVVFGHLFEEIQTQLDQHGYSLTIFANRVDPRETRSYMATLTRSNTDGVIMTQTGTCGKIIAEACRSRGIPLAIIQAPDTIEGVNMVVSNEEEGAMMAVDHLVECGHSSIGIVMNAESRVHRRRFNGYRTAMARHGLQVYENAIVKTQGHSEECARRSLMLHLGSNPLAFSGLICCNDYMALGALKALQHHGYAVPKDVAVLGFDNSISDFTIPPLTSVEFAGAAMARAVVRSLLQQIAEEERAPIAKIVYSPRLVVKGSTVPAHTSPDAGEGASAGAPQP